MSPSLSRRLGEGIPCTTSSLIEMHTVAGKAPVPLEGGLAPARDDERLHVLVDLQRGHARA